MNTHPLMACGHAANAVKFPSNQPCCVICSCDTIVKSQPDLTNRQAKCSYGNHALVASSTNLAFFVYCPDSQTDIYYCGCFGWD